MTVSIKCILASLLALMVCGGAVAQGYRAEILDSKIICTQKDRYIGWPSICRTRDGMLIVAFSGDRDQHVCPWGKSQVVTSTDNGQTWSSPVTVNNSPLDDRDTGLVETPDGALLLTWFTSVVFEKNPEYARHAEKVTPELREQWLGSWTRRSTDGGKTWEAPVRMTGTAPHGSTVLKDGRLLMVGNAMRGEKKLVVEASEDNGRSWQVISEVPIADGEQYNHYHEPHVAELPDGKLVAMFRYEPGDREQNFMRQSESSDGGKTWTPTHKTPLWGYPPHLLVLDDGRLLVVYGRRKAPFGERACLSRDGGVTWDADREITLCEGVNTDLGYPASVQLADGSILTVYYQDPGPEQETSLWVTHWRLVNE